MKPLLARLAGVSALVFASGVLAQTWPSKSIRFVVPFPPAGALDIVARSIGAKLSEQLGQPVVIDNKAGASGSIGVHEIARAAPDGYNIVLGEPAGVTIAPAVRKDLPYDPLKDLVPITPVATIPMVIVAPPNSPAKTLRALVEAHKGKSDPLHFGSPGNASVQHLTGERLKLASGLPLAHVPYKGGMPAVNDLMGGNLQLVLLTMPTLTGHMKAGKLTGLAILSKSRNPAFPDLPTVTESGYPGFEQGIWMGVFAAGGTPRPIIDRLHAEIVKALGTKEVRDRLESTGNDIHTSTPDEFTASLRAEMAQWVTVVRDAGMAPK